MAIDMSPNAVKLRRFSFLSGYALRTGSEEREVHELDKHFTDIGDHPGWPIVPREFTKVEVKVEDREFPVKVNHAFLLEYSPDVQAVGVDFGDKRLGVIATGADEDVPCVVLENFEEQTVSVTFPTYKGWTIWSASTSKYTLHVCFIR
jgi:hypothetical protein